MTDGYWYWKERLTLARRFWAEEKVIHLTFNKILSTYCVLRQNDRHLEFMLQYKKELCQNHFHGVRKDYKWVPLVNKVFKWTYIFHITSGNVLLCIRASISSQFQDFRLTGISEDAVYWSLAKTNFLFSWNKKGLT